MERLTLEQLKASKLNMLTPEIVGNYICMKPDKLREYARTGQLKGMFPYIISGNHVKFPRIGFINWVEGRNNG